MAQRIASLYAEIGADTRGLDRGLKDSKSGLQGAASGLKSFGVAAGLAFAAAGAAAYSMKKAFDFAKEVAGIEFTAEKFDRLSESIGTTSDVLLNDLKMATKGTVSDLELVASATGFMELGLVKTREEAVRLTRVAGQLGMDMNQLTLTLTNQTTMRFDALGVSVDGFKERVDALKASGMSAEDAFNEAFLQQAEQQIEKVGDVADTTAGKLMMIESSLKNVGDAYKRQFAPAVKSAADVAAEAATGLEKMTDLQFGLDKAVKDGIMSQLQMAQVLQDVRYGVIDIDSAIEQLANNYSYLGPGVDDVSEKMARQSAQVGIVTTALQDNNRATTEITGSMLMMSDAQEIAARAADDALASQIAYNANQFAMASGAQAAAADIFGLMEVMKDATAVNIASAAMDELKQQISAIDPASAGAAIKIANLRSEYEQTGLQSGILTEDQIAQATAFDLVTSATEAGRIGWESYGEAQEAARLAIEEGKTPTEALATALNSIGGSDGAAYSTETAMKSMADIIEGDAVTGKMTSFAEDTLEGTVAGGFTTVWSRAGLASGAISKVATQMKALDGMSADVYINVHESGGGGNKWQKGEASASDVTGATGLNFIVPPGYPNDSFNVGVQSGERVVVTPAGGNPGGGGNSEAIVSEIRALRRELPIVMRDAVQMGAA